MFNKFVDNVLIIIAFASMAIAATLFADVALGAPAKRLILKAESTVIIKGAIGRNGIAIADEILKKAALPGPLSIVLNSPGGSVFTGNMIIQAIEQVKSRGKAVHCVVTRFAASMAFLIFNECNRRYALATSLLLWHAPRIQLYGIYYPGNLRPLYDQLKQMEDFYTTRVLKNLRISKKKYEYYSANDFFHFGSELKKIDPKYLKIVADVRVVKKARKKK